MKIVSKEDFLAFVNALIKDGGMDIEGVKSKDGRFVYGPLESASELRLDYDVTILPPKKYFLPQYETMMKFDLADPFSMKKPENQKKKVIIGMHPYDIIALRQMDSYFLDTDVSTTYLKRRKNTLIIGTDPLNVSEKAFFGIMGTGEVHSGYDLFITDLGDRVAITIGTEEGGNLLRYESKLRDAIDVSLCGSTTCYPLLSYDQLLQYENKLRDASPVEVQKVKAIREAASSKAMRGLKVKPVGWHDLLEKNYDSEVWKKQSDKCLGCGTCTLVCPTCFCYDVQDDINIDLKTGERRRTWDGCLLRKFTELASGEVLREDILDRYRHRFYRKGRYLPDRLGFVACVGCGRCSSQCIPDIADPVNAINMLFDSSQHVVKESLMDTHTIRTDLSKMESKDGDIDALHVPMPATLKRVEKLTEKETLFEITPDSRKPLGHTPGQFVEVSIMGMGEAPLSVSSAPDGKTFEIVVRKVGDLTTKLHTLKPGDKVGIRGPFGNGFDVDSLKGKNLIFIGGGIGIIPMRSLINYVLDHRKGFGKVAILYGCKEPREVLFKDELAAWDKLPDIEHLRTVDKCPDGVSWECEIGVITTLIPKIKFDPKSTIAIVVGPPIMYKFVIRDLLKLGMPEENVIVSLERRMKCGVGKCGHCQINGVYVCKEGPVFNYKDLKNLPEAFK